MLPKKKRVNKELFGLIMKNGLIISGHFFVFRYMASKIPLLACVAPKSMAKKAVLRNKLRRRVYGILKNTLILQGSGIFFYKKTGVMASTQEIKGEIELILKKAGFLKDGPWGSPLKDRP